MKTVTLLIFAAALVSAAVSADAAKIERSSISFGPGDQYTGYLARPEGQGPFPGVVVIHEWWGLNDNIKTEADKLARDGYVALAVDLFGKTTTDPQVAMQMVKGLDQQKANAQLLAAANHLRSLPYVRRDRVGSIGWCFGGRQSLNLAMLDPKLSAAVVYYGQPVPDVSQLSKIKAAVLGIYGEADKSIPLAQARAFEQGLKRAKVKHEFYTYPGAGHAFANPSGGASYKPEAAKDAWNKTEAFLRRYLKQ